MPPRGRPLPTFNGARSPLPDPLRSLHLVRFSARRRRPPFRPRSLANYNTAELLLRRLQFESATWPCLGPRKHRLDPRAYPPPLRTSLIPLVRPLVVQPRRRSVVLVRGCAILNRRTAARGYQAYEGNLNHLFRRFR